MPIAIVKDETLDYPSGDDWYSPDQAWPEYAHAHVSRSPNPVYRAVRECFAAANLDRANFGTKAWNPLREYVRPGSRVFVLCNFVEHRIGGTTHQAFLAKCTHGSVVRAVIDYVLLALGSEGSVAFGNAPLQSCNWDAVTRESGAKRVEQFYAENAPGGPRVELVDLRQHIIRRNLFGAVSTELHVESDENSVEVELGSHSLIDALYAGGAQPKFRVLDYDSRRTERRHSRGHHSYIINRRILESDVVISIPKLKTHEKVGITCGIKGCVGTVAHKDCLAHHRYGPPRRGGDEYPDQLAMLGVVSAIHDRVYSTNPGPFHGALHSVDHLARKVVRRFTRALSGSWPGNDTCWRMAVDLARIVRYGNAAGVLDETRPRAHLMITDGVVAGEGDGPLSPRPVRFGYVSFSDDVLAGDYANAMAMGFDPERLPMLARANSVERYRLSDSDPLSVSVSLNRAEVPMESLRGRFGRKFLPASEWRELL